MIHVRRIVFLYRVRFPAVRTATLSVFLVLAWSACENSRHTNGDPCCDSAAQPVFLASLNDDDDGDGNPRDEDFPDINDEDDDIADHAWVRDDGGVFHLFFHSEGLYEPSVIEHYTSFDLRSLQYVGVALRPAPGAWDQDGVWAPCVIREDGMYYMFYTGISGTGSARVERIGLATSADLHTWSRVPGGGCANVTGDGCVYECRESWTTVGAAVGNNNQQCRDPFVMRDTGDARWLLFATARSTNQFGTVTVASSGDLRRWRGEGFIDATRRLSGAPGAQGTGGMAENPFVVTVEETNYLFFTDWRDPEDTVTVAMPRTVVQYATSRTLAVDSLGSAGWTWRGFTPHTGVNAVEVQRLACGAAGPLWLMSFSISSPNSGFSPEHRRELRLVCVRWHGDGTFETVNPAVLPPPRGRQGPVGPAPGLTSFAPGP